MRLRTGPPSTPTDIETGEGCTGNDPTAPRVHAAWQRQIDLWQRALSGVVLVQTPDPRDRCRITHNRIG